MVNVFISEDIARTSVLWSLILVVHHHSVISPMINNNNVTQPYGWHLGSRRCSEGERNLSRHADFKQTPKVKEKTRSFWAKLSTVNIPQTLQTDLLFYFTTEWFGWIVSLCRTNFSIWTKGAQSFFPWKFITDVDTDHPSLPGGECY